MSRALGEEIRKIRKTRGLTLREVESRTGISNAYLSQLETGAAENPTPRILYKLAQVFDVPYESFMRTAGYLEAPEPQRRHSRRRVSALRAALMSTDDLTDEEESRVADFIEFLRTQRKKKDS